MPKYKLLKKLCLLYFFKRNVKIGNKTTTKNITFCVLKNAQRDVFGFLYFTIFKSLLKKYTRHTFFNTVDVLHIAH